MKTISQLGIQQVVSTLRQASSPGKVEDGTRVHLHYEAIGKPSPVAVKEAMRADELGLPRDRYTGRVSRVWRSGKGDMMLSMLVELERDKKYRAFNLTKGRALNIVVLGD